MFNRPGHVFPLVARPGGVIERGGHTEAGVDLCLLAGLAPVAMICELMATDGTMLRLDACYDFARDHSLPIITVQMLVEYRRSQGGGPVVAFPAPEAEVAHAAAVAAGPSTIQEVCEHSISSGCARCTTALSLRNWASVCQPSPQTGCSPRGHGGSR